MSSICYRCLRNSVEGNRCQLCGAPVIYRSPSEDNYMLPLGTRLQKGRFVVGDTLGKGGFGITYVARDLKFNKLIALKEFVPESMLDGRRNLCLQVKQDKKEAYRKHLRSFYREARMLLQMHHPNIVTVYFTFEENNTAYYVMDLLEGENLKNWTKGRLPLHPVEVCSLLLPVMNALIYIHKEKKTLHRDISPDNIFIRKGRQYPTGIAPCLIDFGAAFTAMQDFTLTAPGVEKNGFSPLEQNWALEKQGPFTDVYSFAATFYYLITGRVPLPSNKRQIQDDKFMPPSQLNPKVTPEVERVIQKGLALLPQDRYQDMVQFRQAICEATGVPIVPPPISEPVPWLSPDPIPKPNPIPIPSSWPIPDPWPKPGPKPGPISDPWPDPQEEKRSPKYLAALALDALAFLGLPTAVMATVSPLAGLSIGCGLMLTVNTLLCCLSRRGTLFQHILGCRIDVKDESGTAARLLIYNLLRVLLPFSLVDEALTLAGAIPGSIIESAAGISALTCAQATDLDESMPESMDANHPMPTLAPMPAREARAMPEARLICVAGLLKRRTLPVKMRETLGRNADYASLCFPDQDKAISGRHCMIYFEHGKWLIQDVGSRNGTILNNARLAPDKPAKLSNGDVIRIGEEQFTFQTK